MSDTVTIHGNLGNEPVKNTTTAGASVVNFRVASTSGYWDRRTGSWVDTGTNWYDVAAYRQLADHAKASLHSGDPVIITGTLRLKEWESNGRRGLSAEITAESIGHDLRRGTSAFARIPRPATQTAQATSFPQETPPPAERDEHGTLVGPANWNAAGLEPRDPDAQGGDAEVYAEEEDEVAFAAG